MSTFRTPFWQKQADAMAAITGHAPVRSSSDASTGPPSGAADERREPEAMMPTRPARRVTERRRQVDAASDEMLLTTKEAAKYIHYLYSHRSLERLRTEGGKGPGFVKMPGPKGKVLYPKSELDRWLKELRLYRSTSEYDRS
jgi:hypothetical protein